MKVKFLFLMSILVMVITIALVVPLTQFEIASLTSVSKKDTVTAISIIAKTVGGSFYNYYTGEDKDKRNFLINLQDSLAPSMKEWQDAKYISVIDRDDKIIADTRPVEIDKIYTEYKNLPEFKKAISNTIANYNLKIKNLPKDIEKVQNQIKSTNNQLKVLASKPKEDVSQDKIETLKLKITDLNDRIETLKKEAELAKNALTKIQVNPIKALIGSIFIDFKDAYTIIYPISDFRGDKTAYYGTIIASVSTDFIQQTIFQAIIIAAIIAVLVLIMSVIVIQFYMKIIVNPIIVLTAGVKEVANGNLEMKIPVKGKDEIAVLGNEFNSLIRIWREKLHMEKYVSKSTAEMISKVETGEYNKEPKRQDITIFFSDVRGFTSYSENHDPLDVVNNLNAIFKIQVGLIEKNNGDIDKFVGDEIMAIFPNPAKAFKAAIEIQKELIKFNEEKHEKFEIGIGIHYGEAIVGSLGYGNHFDWTAIGDTVNLGARLCGAAPAGKILMSEESFKRIKTTIQGVEGSIQVKGKKNDIKIYTF